MNKSFHHTKKEIEGQPDLWIETFRSIHENSDGRAFLRSFLEKRDRLNIILTGAGSSAFIGEAVEHLFQGHHISARAIPTTTLVTHFRQYVEIGAPLLLISFARSGNSPESIAAVEIAETYCDDVHHLAITCNRSGMLAQKVHKLKNGYAAVLPPSSEDRGLAMTGSFTSMMLSAIYFSKFTRRKYDDTLNVLHNVAEDSRQLIKTVSGGLKLLSAQPFERIVFLGSGPLLGIARESHLKVQELTDGEVVGKYDSFLGFRHGPKAVVNDKTVLAFLFSSDKHVFRYEKDLAEELLSLEKGRAMRSIGVFHSLHQSSEIPGFDLSIFARQGKSPQPSDFDLLSYVLPAQILGFYKSLDLGLQPDDPSKNDAISRVVRGVKIYSEN